MSAIWGIIDLRNEEITEQEQKKIGKPFAKCAIDRFEERTDNNVFMGCGIQYFTEEAHTECLPMIKPEKGYCFDADVVLDNRKELCKKIELNENGLLPDGTILELMFTKYGVACLDELLGAYAFVYYDIYNNQVELVIDAVGNRCLYYRVLDEKVYFSSLIEPLILEGEKTDINERWISDFLALENLLLVTETEETPIHGIYRVAPGQIVTITQKSIKKRTYWNPLENFKELYLADDKAYAEKFNELFKEAVSCVMRSKEETGILLSGGLDSTAVACFAAPELKSRGKRLYSFTSIPEKGYISQFPSNRITDESEEVLKTKEYLGNIECIFIDLPGVNPWDKRKDQIQCVEIPYKNVLNVLWMQESLQKAADKNIRIMLSGAYGNSGISFSNVEVYINTFFSKGHFVKLWKELSAFQKVYGFSRKYALKTTAMQFLRKKKDNNESVIDRSYLKSTMATKYNVEERLSAMYKNIENAKKDFSKFRYVLSDKKNLRQIGEMETKRSLYTGVLLRDPTRDKRVLEFCLHIPMDQFVRNGIERRLVNVYLSDVMPKHVINADKKGRQSADLSYRISQQWDRIRAEWLDEYKKHIGSDYVDCKKAIQELEDSPQIEEYLEHDIVRHMYTIIVLEYIDYVRDTPQKLR